MRTRMMYLFLFALWTLAGCSGLTVTSDYDNSINFSSYHTYRWLETPDSTNAKDVFASHPFIFRRVRMAVDRELADKGYIMKASGPVDFTVSAHATITEKARFDPPPSFYDYDIGYYHGRARWYRSWWGSPYGYPYAYPYPEVVYYEEGTILVDITDTFRREVAWRGVVRGIIREYRNSDEMQSHVSEAVRKLLSEFPPVRK